MSAAHPYIQAGDDRRDQQYLPLYSRVSLLCIIGPMFSAPLPYHGAHFTLDTRPVCTVDEVEHDTSVVARRCTVQDRTMPNLVP